MSWIKYYQSQDDTSHFVHPLAPGAHGVGGYCRVPGPLGVRDFSNTAGKFGELRKISGPFSPEMKNKGSEEIARIERELAYGPEDVPITMRRKKWPVAANLIEHWINGEAKIMPESVRRGKTSAREYGSINTGIVTMAWVQEFARAGRGISALKGKLVKENTHESIINIIKKNHPGVLIDEGIHLKIDNSLLDVVELHTNWQFQYEQVGSQTDSLDELTAALGRFTLMAALRKAELRKGVIHLTEIGIYVKDIFDFSGWQPLGCWTDSDVYRFGISPFCSSMSNDVFNSYRLRNNKGMDFLIFSDVLVQSVKLDIKIK